MLLSKIPVALRVYSVTLLGFAGTYASFEAQRTYGVGSRGFVLGAN